MPDWLRIAKANATACVFQKKHPLASFAFQATAVIQAGVLSDSNAASPVARGRPSNSRSRLLSGHSGTQAIAAPRTGRKVLLTLPLAGARRRLR